MSLANRLAKAEQALAPTAQEQAADREAARSERYWDALERLLNGGMPRPYAEQVHAELVAGTPHEAWSPLTRRATSLASCASWAPEAVNPRRGPLVIPQAHCEILTAHGDDCDFHGQLRCEACQLEAPCHRWGRYAPAGKVLGPGYGSVSEPWHWQDGLVCVHCGGELRWAPSAVNVWWRDETGRGWRWHPADGHIAPCEW
jgi:hypothetical protein